MSRLLLESHPQFNDAAEAAEPRQAMEQAEASEPDIAVLDMALPNLSGIEAARRFELILDAVREKEWLLSCIESFSAVVAPDPLHENFRSSESPA